ncbi:MAG: UDP-N-acetylmuramate dehydrogenase [Oscillospiraceae bacterium]|nr:UDP-N-acetylmuramate dehydrogenase [Oscillospiraceae bacterium]
MIDLNKLEKICKKYGAEYELNAPLAPYTTFKIGGACDFLVKVNYIGLLQKIVQTGVSYRVLGNGSNVLVSDEGVRGVVFLIGSDLAKIEVTGDEHGDWIHCEAGASLTNLCLAARDAGLTGLEFAYGIPGSVGGAIYMNAGAYGGEMSNVVSAVNYFDENADDGFGTYISDSADFGYRKSPFMGTKKIITYASFELQKGDKAQITAKMNDFMQRRRDKQPLEFPSAGSTFKRPEGDYASRLIDVCGLKGFTVGGAQVSEKHAGFVINKGGATCKDVLTLIEAVRERVFKETGIMLEREVEVIK